MCKRDFSFLHQLFSSDSTASTENAQDESKAQEYRTEPPHHPDRDWIGPVDKRSNLRQIRFAQPQDETVGERKHREMREEIYEWNHAFWAKHNQNFIEAKERFVKEALGTKGVGLLDEDGAKRVLSADEMAKFYREFLQDNRHTLKLYNREWYRRNTALLWPACKIAIQRLFRR
ncbi:COA8 family protein CBG23705, mitochondrial-like isoform X2 [Patiria miniata]|uniref:Apoptogenic protein 1, mitochondrial n=1 Tax=Patiria miniata TaxID=46514 RepID=A0A914BDB8_PATMI|nr:COA8 family protein CBG23705, mitochondrial-like isoform X2 [Patiria miniata]XP_038074640.1 COA8 family protein CBG23705, mitochondrial-like isoform X2 [Patiria miniata]XP_038075795.1 COA8 family protein CBG23705, mitochondrial-like isoform X2 [Patiria miniata]